MAKNRNAQGSAPAFDASVVQPMTQVFSREGGRWATQMMKKAFMEGKALSSAALRTLDTLRHEDWKVFDQALVEEALIRLVGVADLQAAGLVKPVKNSLGKTVFGWEQATFMDPAIVSMDGRAKSTNDKIEFALNQNPLPITHKDFFLNLRQLEASRNSGEPLDTTQVRMAGRVVAEQAEKMLFQGGPTFGGLSTYGYTTHPNRITSVTFDGGKFWNDTTKTGASYLKDVLAAITALQANRMYGPYWIYVPTDAGVVLDNDYNAGSANNLSIRERISKVENIKAIRTADQLPTHNVIVVQASQDVVCWVEGEPLQTVQWDEAGGFDLNFKAWQIAVPLIRSDAQVGSGVCHISATS
jgi:uncharacterized linocin/CFP29 family protein